MKRKPLLMSLLALSLMTSPLTVFANEDEEVTVENTTQVQEEGTVTVKQGNDGSHLNDKKGDFQDQRFKEKLKEQMNEKFKNQQNEMLKKLKEKQEEMMKKIKEQQKEQLKKHFEQFADKNREEMVKVLKEQMKDKFQENAEAEWVNTILENPELAKKIAAEIKEKQEKKAQEIKEKVKKELEEKIKTELKDGKVTKENKEALLKKLHAMREELKKQQEEGVELKEEFKDLTSLYEKLGDRKEAIENQMEMIKKHFRNNKEAFQKLGQLYKAEGKKGIKAFVNGKNVDFDVTPFIEKGRTLVPVRAITASLGAEVAWDNATRTVTVTKEGAEIKLVIGSKVALVNGQEVQLEAPAVIKNGRTFLPMRFISETFKAKVDYIPEGEIITVEEQQPIAEETDVLDETVIEDVLDNGTSTETDATTETSTETNVSTEVPTTDTDATTETNVSTETPTTDSNATTA